MYTQTPEERKAEAICIAEAFMFEIYDLVTKNGMKNVFSNRGYSIVELPEELGNDNSLEFDYVDHFDQKRYTLTIKSLKATIEGTE